MSYRVLVHQEGGGGSGPSPVVVENGIEIVGGVVNER